MQAVVVNQKKLSSECGIVQFWGLEKCKTCEFRKKDCGGKKIRKTGRNELGFKVPLGGRDEKERVGVRSRDAGQKNL